MLDVCARFETVPKGRLIERSLSFPQPIVTVRELITQYIVSGEGAPLLVQPTEKEIALNDDKGMRLNSEKHITRALTAFCTNGFVLLVDDRQVDDLDDEVELNEASVVTFLRLTPLVGG